MKALTTAMFLSILMSIAQYSTATTSGAVATGGTITTNGAYMIHTFTNDGSFTVSESLICDMLIVAGGGGGGCNDGGGGGAGGVVPLFSNAISAGSYSVTIGTGGVGAVFETFRASSGGNTIFGTNIAIGGGAAGGEATTGVEGWDGGSGGGDGNYYPTGPGGSGTANQGNNGGTGYQIYPWVAGGGGGANAVGADGVGGVGGGAGGSGADYSEYFGTSIGESGWFGGGGGGCPLGTGGSGGGGDAGSVTGTGSSGLSNTGGGGGGGGYHVNGGHGGSGIVIVRYYIAGVPSQVTNVVASDGTYPDYVLITWYSVSGATAYEVWRNTSNDVGSAAKITELQTTATGGMSYSDSDVSDNVTYYYWVRASNSVGDGPFSVSDAGYISSSVIAPPTGVTASKGAYTNKVSVMWNAVAGATGYEIWRAMLNLAPFATKLTDVTETSYSDSNVAQETIYYYWLKSKNTSQTSGFSEYDSGYVLDTSSIQPDIKINGSDSATSLHLGQTLALSITMMTSSSANADWWLIAVTPGGWYCYVANTGLWLNFTDISTLYPSYQGPLFDFIGPVTVFNGSTAWLPAGSYVFYFGVDLNMNGVLDSTGLYYDSVSLTITQ